MCYMLQVATYSEYLRLSLHQLGMPWRCLDFVLHFGSSLFFWWYLRLNFNSFDRNSSWSVERCLSTDFCIATCYTHRDFGDQTFVSKAKGECSPPKLKI